ncbi:MAG: hypothetical protein HY903_13500 [Deltaproteobacteria bacterium]|nr:hypothetical protein [Deltaproteobacteria bacterium]
MTTLALCVAVAGSVGVTTGAGAAAVPDEVASQVTTWAASAEADGLPSERLMIKAQEGAAKGIPAARILAVVATMLERMREAATLIDGVAGLRLDPKERRTLVGAVAAALQAGVGKEAIRGVAKVGFTGQENRRGLHGAVLALADLSLQGVKDPEAETLVELALQRGFTDGDFPKLLAKIRELSATLGPSEALKAARALVESERRAPGPDPAAFAPGRGPPPGVGKNGKGAAKPKRADPKGKP